MELERIVRVCLAAGGYPVFFVSMENQGLMPSQTRKDPKGVRHIVAFCTSEGVPRVVFVSMANTGLTGAKSVRRVNESIENWRDIVDGSGALSDFHRA